MQYFINALLKNNNELMQYCIINNDIALIMHYRALLQMPGYKALPPKKNFLFFLLLLMTSIVGTKCVSR